MFERFTDRARRVIVLSQDEARGLQHNYIGTEHILLGLLGVPNGVAGRVLDRFGMTVTGVREQIIAMVGTGDAPTNERIPFTPRAKKILELALREALQLHHNYIGTEHILLGLIREGDGVGAQIVTSAAGDLARVRIAVLDLLPSGQVKAARRANLGDLVGLLESERAGMRTTPAAATSLDEAAKLAGPRPVGSHHLLLAALSDPDTAAARALTSLGLDLDQAREALRNTEVTGSSDELPEERGRRHMLIRATGEAVTIEATDTEIVGLAAATIEALGDKADPPGTIRGDLPGAVSLEKLWRALRDSLDDIRRSAAADPPKQPSDNPAESA